MPSNIYEKDFQAFIKELFNLICLIVIAYVAKVGCVSERNIKFEIRKETFLHKILYCTFLHTIWKGQRNVTESGRCSLEYVCKRTVIHVTGDKKTQADYI